MQVSVKGQHVDVGDSLRKHVEEKLEAIKQKYFNRVTDATVTFTKESHHYFRAHVTFHVGHDVKVQANAHDADPYIAFDEAAERVAKQLRRYKNRLRDHHERLEKTPEAAFIQARDYILQTEGVDIAEDKEDETKHAEPIIVAEITTSIPSMSVSEAVMRMDLADQDYMLFKNAKTDTLNVVYRRPDGNIGWIDPSLQAGSAGAKSKVA
ncbi:MAG: ribosome-associated translation inhibitor RaiA [Alphaproteobacteria bacterium]|nr:ribosome-associated translation inhibitor RaiA [Alphaproteobacteria bacterium]